MKPPRQGTLECDPGLQRTTDSQRRAQRRRESELAASRDIGVERVSQRAEAHAREHPENVIGCIVTPNYSEIRRKGLPYWNECLLCGERWIEDDLTNTERGSK